MKTMALLHQPAYHADNSDLHQPAYHADNSDLHQPLSTGYQEDGDLLPNNGDDDGEGNLRTSYGEHGSLLPINADEDGGSLLPKNGPLLPQNADKEEGLLLPRNAANKNDPHAGNKALHVGVQMEILSLLKYEDANILHSLAVAVHTDPQPSPDAELEGDSGADQGRHGAEIHEVAWLIPIPHPCVKMKAEIKIFYMLTDMLDPGIWMDHVDAPVWSHDGWGSTMLSPHHELLLLSLQHTPSSSALYLNVSLSDAGHDDELRATLNPGHAPPASNMVQIKTMMPKPTNIQMRLFYLIQDTHAICGFHISPKLPHLPLSMKAYSDRAVVYVTIFAVVVFHMVSQFSSGCVDVIAGADLKIVVVMILYYHTCGPSIYAAGLQDLARSFAWDHTLEAYSDESDDNGNYSKGVDAYDGDEDTDADDHSDGEEGWEVSSPKHTSIPRGKPSSARNLQRTRTRSLTDEDLEELRGCMELGLVSIMKKVAIY